jgi:hypothetical protein
MTEMELMLGRSAAGAAEYHVPSNNKPGSSTRTVAPCVGGQIRLFVVVCVGSIFIADKLTLLDVMGVSG